MMQRKKVSFLQFYLYTKFGADNCNNSKLKIIKFYYTSGQENCLTDGSAFCDAQSPCCDGSSCVLIGMITQCAKKNSGKYNCPLRKFFPKEFNVKLSTKYSCLDDY